MFVQKKSKFSKDTLFHDDKFGYYNTVKRQRVHEKTHDSHLILNQRRRGQENMKKMIDMIKFADNVVTSVTQRLLNTGFW